VPLHNGKLVTALPSAQPRLAAWASVATRARRYTDTAATAYTAPVVTYLAPFMSLREPFRAEDLSVTISELLVATAESSDPLVDDSVSKVLAALRERLCMDVVFVSEFVDGRRMFRFVDTGRGAPDIRAGDSNPLEESVCKRIVDQRLPEMIEDLSALPAHQLPTLPFKVGAHLSTPIVLESGRTYGTLCCFSVAPSPTMREEDLKNLRLCARLVAKKLELAVVRGLHEPPPDWQLEPADVYESKVWGASATSGWAQPSRRSSKAN
jgi:hypothetical protein